MSSAAYPQDDPSFGPAYVDEDVLAAQAWILNEKERRDAWDRMTNSAPWTTAVTA